MTNSEIHYGAKHTVLHERSFPHRLTAGVWMWSVYAEEKGLDFNGYLIEIAPNRAFIVDPPCAGPEVLDGFTPLPQIEFIFLTNADHERAAADFRARFKLPVIVHELDAPRLELQADRTVPDGHTLEGGWQVIHLPEQKTPGESALYHAQRQMLILGDALIGKPYQTLSMLPAEKYANREKARESLQRCLGNLAVQSVLVGDGDPLMLDAESILKDALIQRPQA